MLERLRELYGDAVRILNGTKGVDTPEWEGKVDPLGGLAICTPEGRGVYKLGNDGKLYTPFAANGYPPAKTVVLAPNSGIITLELTAGAAVNIPTQSEGVILKPAAATLQAGAGAVIPATANDIYFHFRNSTATAMTAGVVSCWVMYSAWNQGVQTAVSR